MNKLLRKLLVGITFAASTFMAHAAQVYDLNRETDLTISGMTTGFSGAFDGSKGKTFRDTFNFSVGSSSNLVGGIISIAASNMLDLDLTGFSLLKDGQVLANGSGFGGAFDVWTLSYDNLASGSYTLAVTGKVLGSFGGSYGGNFNVSPVPEPETWGMMLGGLALVGFLARRRKQADNAGFAAA